MDVLDIKRKITGLGPGEFQNMCNEILYRQGYKNINQLGSHTLSNKTTKGTPDTFASDNGKYIAVEYTTQIDGLADKIKDDINKCVKVFERAKINDKNTEIIYFHTSSNLKLEEFNNIEKLCNDSGTNIKIYSIDEIAYLLKYEYVTIAKDYLKIEVDTLQILQIEDFINQYNANKLTVKINEKLLYRDEEIDKSISIINDVDYIILSGPAGTGKTHFCVELCKKYKDINKNINVVCIRNNNLQLYEDLQKYFKENEEYLIFIDDANMLTNIAQVLDYIKIHQFKTLKVIMTVRDYAKSKVLNLLSKYYIVPENIVLKPLTEEQIKEILSSELGIKNSTYIDQIQKISLSNPRIAMMAGKVAKEKGFKEIISGEQIYDVYFKNVIDELMIQNENKIVKSAGLIAFLNSVNRTNEKFKELLEKIDISMNDFWDAIQVLNGIEFVDVLNDKMTKISEQCLANYLLYLVFIKNKYISIKTIIEVTFNVSRERMIESLNTLINIFYSKNTIDVVEDSIKNLWEDIKAGKNKDIDEQEFLDTFHALLPIETLNSISERISQESIENIKLDINEIRNIKKEKNYSIENKELTRLIGYRDSEHFDMAVQLLFIFFKKKPSLMKDIYFCVKNYISFRINDIRNNYVVQNIFIDELIKQYKEPICEENIIILGLTILPIFLKTYGDYAENVNMKTMRICNYTLAEDEGLRKIRNKIFKFLLDVYDQHVNYRREIDNIFNDLYIREYKNRTLKEIMKNDLLYIEEFRKKVNETNFFEVLVVNNILEELKTNKLSIDISEDIKNNKIYNLYKILKGKNKDYDDKIRQREIRKIIKNATLDEIRKIFENINEILRAVEENVYDIKYGVDILFSEIFNNRQDKIQIIQEFITSGAKTDIDFSRAVEILYNEYEFDKLYKYIAESNIKNKFCWKVACFSEIPTKNIDQYALDEWYRLIGEKIELPIVRNINLHFLKKYISIDSNVFINTLKIINRVYDNDEQIIYTFTNLLFWRHNAENADFLISVFTNDISLLIDIYFKIYKIEQYFDYNGLYFNKILNIAEEKLLDEYIRFRMENSGYYNNHNETIRHIWNMNAYDKVIDIFLNKIDKITVRYKRQHLLEGIFSEEEYTIKQDKWIEEYIEKNNTDIDKMEEIFNIISEFDEERRLKFIQTFLNVNSDFYIFDKISLISSSMSWSGSEIPVIENRINFYKKVAEILTDIKYLKHRIKIENIINGLKKYKESTKEREFLDEYI